MTRFLESARLAFARERDLWASLGIAGHEQIRISAPNHRYKVALHRHIAAVDDAETLHASVLIHSYALAESAAADRLGIPQRSLGKIEGWGTRLLEANACGWIDVEGGRVGAVEVAVTRNAFAHGSRTIDAAAHKRLHAAGIQTRPVGSAVTLTYDELRGFRARLLSLLNAAGIGR